MYVINCLAHSKYTTRMTFQNQRMWQLSLSQKYLSQRIPHGTASPSQAGLLILYICFAFQYIAALCSHYPAVSQQQVQLVHWLPYQ